MGDVLIVFRRLASATGGSPRAVAPGRAPLPAQGEGRRSAVRPSPRGEASPGEDVRVLRLRPKVLSPR